MASAELEADERLLRDLAGAADVDSKISGSGAGDDAHGGVLKLAWGVLLSQYGPEHAAGEGVFGLAGCETRCHA